MEAETSPGPVPCVAVVAGGPGAAPRPAPALAPGTIVVAADSGVDVALAAGYPVHVAVGDFDSVTPAGLAAAVAAGARVERHPRDKDATDLELALDVALGFAPERVVVVGTTGGRLDHELSVLQLLAGPRLAEVDVLAHLGPAVVAVVRPERPQAWTAVVGELVSLLSIHGDATGVTTAGLRWSLDDDDLAAGTTRGCSNEVASSRVRVSCTGGVLLVVCPGPSADPHRHDPERSPR